MTTLFSLGRRGARVSMILAGALALFAGAAPAAEPRASVIKPMPHRVDAPMRPAPPHSIEPTPGTPLLTLAEAIARAERTWAEGKAAQHYQEEAIARRRAATAALLPRFRAEAGVQLWDSPARVSLLSGAPPDTTGLPPNLAQLVSGLTQPILVRDRVTSTASITVAQPITGLYPLIAARQIESRGADAADAAKTKTDVAVAAQVVEAYAQALLAEAGLRVAERGVELGASALAKAEQLVGAGMVNRSDALQAKANLAAARETAIGAKVGVEVSRAGLAMLVGFTAEQPFALQPPRRALPPLPRIEALLREAEAARPELVEARARVAQAEGAVHVAISRMVPEITALANYTHSEGNKFAIPNAFFVGGTLTWDFFEFGNKWFGIDAAKAKAAAAQAELEKAKNLLSLELRQVYAQARVAEERLAAARAGLEASQALLKNEETRYQTGTTTATELLLAQNRALQAELNLAAAELRVVSARTLVEKAQGRMTIFASD